MSSSDSSTEAAEFFPRSDQAWVDAAAVLLGPRPQIALVVPCGCALVGLTIHYWREKVVLPVVFTVVGLFSSNIAWFLNSGCEILHFECPEETPWKWFLVGSLVWTALAAGGVFKNLSDIPVGKDKEKKEDKDLKALFDKLAKPDGRMEFSEFKVAVQSGALVPGSFSWKGMVAKLKANRERNKTIPGYMKIPQIGSSKSSSGHSVR